MKNTFLLLASLAFAVTADWQDRPITTAYPHNLPASGVNPSAAKLTYTPATGVFKLYYDTPLLHKTLTVPYVPFTATPNPQPFL